MAKATSVSLHQTEKKRPLNCVSHLDTLQTLADDLPVLQFYQPFWVCVAFPAK